MAAALLTTPAFAQAPGRRAGSPGVPCASAAGEIVALALEGSGAPAGTVVTFGQAFRPGDLPRQARLGARRRDGRPVQVQLDVTTRHGDGSARFGIVSLAQPEALAARQTTEIVLIAGSGEAPPALDLRTALGDRQAVLEVTPRAGGTPWRVDLFRAALEAGDARAAWQSGPLAAQRRFALPVPPAAVGGATSARLVADVSARTDGSVWIDLWLRNDVAMRPGGGLAEYAARLTLDGREVLRTAVLRHHQYTAWGRLVGAARGGQPAPTPPRPRMDVAYLAETGAIARYDQSVGVADALLAGYGQAIAAPGWTEPFNPRGITQYMPMTGGRGDIGPTTAVQAAWLVSGDARAAAVALGQAEAAGAIPWHFWDVGGNAGQGGWLDVVRWPRLWIDGRGGAPPNGLAQPLPSGTGWDADTAHQPDLCYVPYLLTGRRAFLDGLQAQAAFNVVAQWPDPRGGGEANLVRWNQTRGTAWALRQLHEAGWISPDDDPGRAYFQRCERANWAWIRSQIPVWTRQMGETHGRVPGDYERPSETSPWQQDYLATTVAAAARKGDEDAKAILAYMSNFLVGRFLAGQRGFNPRDGAAYLIPATNAESVPYRSWAEIGAQARARGLSNGDGWSKTNGDYAQLALASLAGIVDVLGTAEARRAFDWLSAAGAPFTEVSAYMREPTWNIVPRGMHRVAGKVQACPR